MKCLLNRRLVDEAKATISPFDRGYLFADGIYEVIAIVDGLLLDSERHWIRLERSCGEINLPLPMGIEELKSLIADLVSTNAVKEGRVYFQITRGVAERDFAFPAEATPQLFAFVREASVIAPPQADIGIDAVTVEDLRWKRRDIKSIALLPQTMAKQEAKARGAGEAIMMENGFITEGSSSTIHLIKDGKLITRQLSNEVLPGVTRMSIFDVARDLGMVIEERAFTVQEAQHADELFLTSASAIVQGIVRLDDVQIANGSVGLVTHKLRKTYLERSVDEAKRIAMDG